MSGSLARPLKPNAYVLVLAGGRGSRLRQLTDHRAKPAVPFGGSMRIIDFALGNCVNSGLRRIGVLTQYKAQSLIRHVERSWGFLEDSLGEYVDVLPAQQQIDEGWYSGTANAVHQNMHIVREARPDHVEHLLAERPEARGGGAVDDAHRRDAVQLEPRLVHVEQRLQTRRSG